MIIIELCTLHTLKTVHLGKVSHQLWHPYKTAKKSNARSREENILISQFSIVFDVLEEGNSYEEETEVSHLMHRANLKKKSVR